MKNEFDAGEYSQDDKPPIIPGFNFLLRLAGDEHARIKARAAELGIPKAEYIRRCLRAELETRVLGEAAKHGKSVQKRG